MIWTKGDNRPLDITLTRGGVAENLTGATVEIHLAGRYGQGTPISAACTLLVAAAGQVRYTWGAGESEQDGIWNVEWQVTDSGGKIETFPLDGPDVIEFHADLAD